MDALPLDALVHLCGFFSLDDCRSAGSLSKAWGVASSGIVVAEVRKCKCAAWTKAGKTAPGDLGASMSGSALSTFTPAACDLPSGTMLPRERWLNRVSGHLPSPAQLTADSMDAQPISEVCIRNKSRVATFRLHAIEQREIRLCGMDAASLSLRPGLDARWLNLKAVLCQLNMSNLHTVQSLSLAGLSHLELAILPPNIVTLNASNCSRLRAVRFGAFARAPAPAPSPPVPSAGGRPSLSDRPGCDGFGAFNLSGCRELRQLGALCSPRHRLARCQELELSWCQRLAAPCRLLSFCTSLVSPARLRVCPIITQSSLPPTGQSWHA